MQPDQDFIQSNFTFKRPEGTTAEECGDLKVYKNTDNPRWPFILSKWKPTPEDIQRLSEGGSVYLWIYGAGMPPVSVTTENPWPTPKKPEGE